jgi:hypothetical protein
MSINYFGEANVGILTLFHELIIEFCKENQVILARFDLKIRTNHNLLEDEFQQGLFLAANLLSDQIVKTRGESSSFSFACWRFKDEEF